MATTKLTIMSLTRSYDEENEGQERTGGKLDFYCSRKIMQMCRRQRQLTLATLAMPAMWLNN